MRSRFLTKFGICLFSACILAVGFCSTASAHYNGDHIDFQTRDDIFILELIPTPLEEVITVSTNSSGQKFQIQTSYVEGINGTTLLTQTYIGGSSGSTSNLSTGKSWNVTVKLPYIGGVLSKTEFLNYVANTNYIALSFEFDMDIDQSSGSGHAISASGDIIPDTTATTNGASFMVAQSVGNLNRYTWFFSIDNGEFDEGSLIDQLLSGSVPSVDGNVDFVIPFKNSGAVGYNKSFVTDLGVFTITNNPAGALLPDSDSTTVIVDGLDNLGDAIDTSIAAGVEEISSVVLQQTNEITGAVESQTEAILNYRSDVDMSVSQNIEVATKLAEETLINQQIYDQYTDIEYDYDLSGTIDSDFGDGVGFLASAMQMIFDFGVGNLVLVLLTIGISLFIIGRSMR